jgi:steroid delta-isomerase-like uncharacterized protein
MSVESTREVIRKYWYSKHADVSMMAEDVVFTVMASGQEAHGPEGVLGSLNHFYHVAFDATAENTIEIVENGKVVWDGYFVGKHIGEFSGVPATGKQVRVPLCIVYELEDEQIKKARVYFEMPVLLQQLGVPMGSG